MPERVADGGPAFGRPSGGRRVRAAHSRHGRPEQILKTHGRSAVNTGRRRTSARTDLIFDEFADENVRGPRHEVEEHVLLYVAVLVDEPAGRVRDGTRVVHDAELGFPFPAVVALHEVRMGPELCVQVHQVRAVRSLTKKNPNVSVTLLLLLLLLPSPYLGHVTLFGEQFQHAPGRFLDELQARRVVGEPNVREFYVLLSVLHKKRPPNDNRTTTRPPGGGGDNTYDLLFEREHVMIEELVQFLVRVVDAQLFERVDGEILETEYVEHAEEPGRVLARIRARVDVIDEPRERPRVQRFGHGVPVFDGLRENRV